MSVGDRKDTPVRKNGYVGWGKGFKIFERGAAPHPSQGLRPLDPNGALPCTPPGASPLGTPTGRCPVPRQGLRPLEPRFNYSYSIMHWLDECALCTSLTRFRT